MQGIFRCLVISVVTILFNHSVYAALPAGTAGVRAAVAGVASRTQVAAGAETGVPQQAPQVGGPAAPAPETGFLEMVAGVGISQVKTGKSQLGISPTESDLVDQANNDYHSYVGHVGIGYHYYLGAPDRFSKDFAWFPSIEPILNLYYYNLQPKGNVYLFNDPNLGTSTFEMPIHTTSLMIDVLLNVFTVNHFSFFALGGAGEAWSSIDYHDRPNPTGALMRPALDLNSRSQSNSVYEWGTGVSYAFNPRIKMAFEYLYTHFGNIRTKGTGTLGEVPTDVDPAGFSLRTQTFMLDIYATFC